MLLCRKIIFLACFFCASFFVGSFFSVSAQAFPTRPFSAGVGLGVPEFVFLEAQVAAFSRCQIGATYAKVWVPGVMPKDIAAPTQTVTLFTGDEYAIDPKVSPDFSAISPFLRVFPDSSNNFFLQFTWIWMKIDSFITGTFAPQNNVALPEIPMTGTVTINQYLPTVSVGYLFSSQIYYLNLSIGIGYILKPSTSTSANLTIPDSLGGNAGNQDVIDGFNADIQKSVVNATEEIRNRFGIFPSLHFSFGIYF